MNKVATLPSGISDIAKTVVTEYPDIGLDPSLIAHIEPTAHLGLRGLPPFSVTLTDLVRSGEWGDVNYFIDDCTAPITLRDLPSDAKHKLHSILQHLAHRIVPLETYSAA